MALDFVDQWVGEMNFLIWNSNLSLDHKILKNMKTTVVIYSYLSKQRHTNIRVHSFTKIWQFLEMLHQKVLAKANTKSFAMYFVNLMAIAFISNKQRRLDVLRKKLLLFLKFHFLLQLSRTLVYSSWLHTWVSANLFGDNCHRKKIQTFKKRRVKNIAIAFWSLIVFKFNFREASTNLSTLIVNFLVPIPFHLVIKLFQLTKWRQ